MYVTLIGYLEGGGRCWVQARNEAIVAADDRDRGGG